MDEHLNDEANDIPSCSDDKYVTVPRCRIKWCIQALQGIDPPEVTFSRDKYEMAKQAATRCMEAARDVRSILKDMLP